MNQEQEIQDFNKSKIYERLDYVKEPANYDLKIPWIVQQQIAATNGRHYIDRIGKLNEYPVYELPVKAVTGNKLMLDIGCGWGRWLVAGANKGYTPIGVDLRLEFCQTSLNVLKDLNKVGYTLVADLEELPFKDSIFDLVWSFSVIQHTHHSRLVNCLYHINRILLDDGFTMLEFPNKDGIRNSMSSVLASEKNKNNYNSWCVRYYNPKEYKLIVEKYLNNFSYSNHSFLGIGVLKEDLKYVSAKNKILTSVSLLLSQFADLIPTLKKYSDSIYINASKKKSIGNVDGLPKQLASKSHDNLSITPLLKCPKYGGDLSLSNDRKKLTSLEAGIYYPIENDIPILIKSEALAC